MTLICEYCKNEFNNNRELHRHQKRTKYCIEIQQKIRKDDFKTYLVNCKSCNRLFAADTIERHLNTCKSIENQELLEYKSKINNYYKDQLSIEKIKYNEIEVKYERMLKPVIANKYSEKDIRENIEEMHVNLLRSLPSIVNGCHVYSAVIDIQIKDGVLEVLYKVGFTTDVNERFKQHKYSYPMFIPIAIIPVSSIKIEKEVHASIPSELRVKYNNEREIYKYDGLPNKFIEYIQDTVKAKDIQNKDNIIRDLKHANELKNKDIRIQELEKDIIIMKLQHKINMLTE